MVTKYCIPGKVRIKRGYKNAIIARAKSKKIRKYMIILNAVKQSKTRAAYTVLISSYLFTKEKCFKNRLLQNIVFHQMFDKKAIQEQKQIELDS